MIRRRRASSQCALRLRERLVQEQTAWHQGAVEGKEEIALQVPGDDDELEALAWKGEARQIGAPDLQGSTETGRRRGRAQRFEVHVHTEDVVALLREQPRVSAASHGEIERAPARREELDRSGDPLDNEGRGRLDVGVRGHILVAWLKRLSPQLDSVCSV